MNKAHIVYKKYCSGEEISDEELQAGIEFFKHLEEDLRVLGPEFRLAANEVSRVLDSLESFARARADIISGYPQKDSLRLKL
jgi:hypothetical protein